MKCERCGHQLDDDDLFCSKCGKAVFEEYMDEDDIWEHYKPDSDFEREEKEEKEAAILSVQENPESETDGQEETIPEARRIEEEKTEPDQEESQETVTGWEEESSPLSEKEQEKEQEEEQEPLRKIKEEQKKGTEDVKKSPLFLVSGCILFLCLILGILWGIHETKEMDKEKKEYYANIEASEKEAESPEGEKTEKEGEDTADEPEAEPEEKSEEEPNIKQEEKPEEEEKKEETKKEDYFVQVDKDSVDLSGYAKIPIAGTDQNSIASSDNYDYSAASAVDGDITSSWQEGEEGVGEGTGIRLDLDGSHKVRYMVLYLGNWRSDNLWEANARPAKLSISVGNLQKDVEFSDEMRPFCLSFDEPVEASSVSLFIKAGYEGDRWNDNCISEVELYE